MGEKNEHTHAFRFKILQIKKRKILKYGNLVTYQKSCVTLFNDFEATFVW